MRRFLFPLVATVQLADGFVLSTQTYCRQLGPPLFMADHSSVTSLKVGNEVTVIADVLKAGKNLRGLSGTVIETWEKCQVDPTCCCSEWVDEGLSVRVRFCVDEANEFFANDTFIHYFAESELAKKKEDSCIDKQEEGNTPIAFDGMSCTAFKVDKLKMGEQAKRIANFEQSRHEAI